MIEDNRKLTSAFVVYGGRGETLGYALDMGARGVTGHPLWFAFHVSHEPGEPFRFLGTFATASAACGEIEDKEEDTTGGKGEQ